MGGYNIYSRRIFTDGKIKWILGEPTLFQRIIKDNKSLCYNNSILTVNPDEDSKCIYSRYKPNQYYTNTGKELNSNLVEDSGLKGKYKNVGKCLPKKAYR